MHHIYSLMIVVSQRLKTCSSWNFKKAPSWILATVLSVEIHFKIAFDHFENIFFVQLFGSQIFSWLWNALNMQHKWLSKEWQHSRNSTFATFLLDIAYKCSKEDIVRRRKNAFLFICTCVFSSLIYFSRIVNNIEWDHERNKGEHRGYVRRACNTFCLGAAGCNSICPICYDFWPIHVVLMALQK